jgi:hypothetical protein
MCDDASGARARLTPVRGTPRIIGTRAADSTPAKQRKMRRPPSKFGTGRLVMLSQFAAISSDYWSRVAIKNAIRASQLGMARPSNGRVRLRKMFEDFYSGMPQWQSYQIDVFRMIVCCNLRFVLGDDCSDCLEEVMKEYDWDKLHDEVLIMAYRGSGKSSVVGGYAASAIRNIPNYTACAYAVTKSKSQDLLDTIYKYIMIMDSIWPTGWVVHKSAKEIRINVAYNDVRYIMAFSTMGMVRLRRMALSPPSPLLRFPRLLFFVIRRDDGQKKI